METFTLDKGERDLTKIVAFLSSLSKTRVWEVVVKQYQRPRSDPQNNALWGVAYKYIREQTGNDMDDLHDYFCGEFFGWRDEAVITLRKRKPRRSTTIDENGNRDVMGVEDFMAFYSFIQQRCATELGLNVPDPDPLWFMHKEEKAA